MVVTFGSQKYYKNISAENGEVTNNKRPRDALACKLYTLVMQRLTGVYNIKRFQDFMSRMFHTGVSTLDHKTALSAPEESGCIPMPEF